MVEYECETCGLKEVLTEEEAFEKGWDYPPRIGKWGVVSPRTCGNCPIDTTAWWALMTRATLTEKQKETVVRIATTEPPAAARR